MPQWYNIFDVFDRNSFEEFSCKPDTGKVSPKLTLLLTFGNSSPKDAFCNEHRAISKAAVCEDGVLVKRALLFLPGVLEFVLIKCISILSLIEHQEITK